MGVSLLTAARLPVSRETGERSLSMSWFDKPNVRTRASLVSPAEFWMPFKATPNNLQRFGFAVAGLGEKVRIGQGPAKIRHKHRHAPGLPQPDAATNRVAARPPATAPSASGSRGLGRRRTSTLGTSWARRKLCAASGTNLEGRLRCGGCLLRPW